MDGDEEAHRLPVARANGTGDWFAQTLLASIDRLVRQLPGGWVQRRGDAVGVISGIRIPTLNGVMSASARALPDDVKALLDAVRAAHVPYCLQLRPGASDALTDLAQAAGMSRGDDIAGMVLQNPTALTGALEQGGLVLRRLSMDEMAVHLAVVADAFDLRAEVLAPLVEGLGASGARLYVGEVAGEPIVTGIGIRVADAVGIFNVATRQGHRRRGYGAAVTARAVLDGFADGATRAFLQSTTMARGLYKQLGFEAVEYWQLWLE